MKIEVTAHAFIDDTGKVSMLNRESFVRRLEVFIGEDVTFTVTKRERSISSQQRRWLRGNFLDQVTDYLVNVCGNAPETIDREQLHYDFLSIRFGTKAIGGWVAGAPPRIVPKRTSSDLTVAEVSEYLEWLCLYCAQHMGGLIIVLPDEYLASQQPAKAQPQPARELVGASA